MDRTQKTVSGKRAAAADDGFVPLKLTPAQPMINVRRFAVWLPQVLRAQNTGGR